jgi:predicted metal-dependent RNase
LIGRKGLSLAIQQYRNDDDDQTNDIIIRDVPELCKRIKMAAAQNNLSVQEYLRTILEQVVPPEANLQYLPTGRLNRAAVEKLLRTREAIMKAHPGQIYEDSSELIHQMHEERARELEQQCTFIYFTRYL